MPVRKYQPPGRPANQVDYVNQLAKEWGSKKSTAREPVILEESNRRGHVEHVYVIWSAWHDLDRIARGEIIMDAAEKVKKKSALLKITIAMGLTPDEADRFGLTWRDDGKAA